MNALEPTSRDSITVNLVLSYFIAACQEVRFFWVKEISEKLDINVIKNKPKMNLKEYNSEYSH